MRPINFVRSVIVFALSFLFIVSISGCGSDGCLHLDEARVTSPAHWEFQSFSIANFNPTVSDENNFALPSGYLTDTSTFYYQSDYQLFAAYDTGVGGVVINTNPFPENSNGTTTAVLVAFFCPPGASSLDSLTGSFCRSDPIYINENQECQETSSESRTCIYTFQDLELSDPSGELSTVFHLGEPSEIDTVETYVPESSSCEFVALRLKKS